MKKDFLAVLVGVVGAYFACVYLKKRMDDDLALAYSRGEKTRSAALGVRG